MAIAEQPAAPSALARPLTTRLARLVPLSAEETAALEAMQATRRPVARSADIVRAGRNYDGVFVLIEGAAMRYRVLRDGRRQVLNIALPGDLVGFPSCFFDAALFSITALTEAAVSWVPFHHLFALFRQHPRLAAILFCTFSYEAAMYAERLIDVGRRSARERVAHFLLELLTRLQAIGQAGERSFRMPLTQELIGDALGLSVPHVNRTLRRLREEELVTVDGQNVAITDIDGLTAVADFETGYLSRFRIGELLV